MLFCASTVKFKPVRARVRDHHIEPGLCNLLITFLAVFKKLRSGHDLILGQHQLDGLTLPPFSFRNIIENINLQSQFLSRYPLSSNTNDTFIGTRQYVLGNEDDSLNKLRFSLTQVE